VYSENSNFTVRVTDSSHINLSIAVPAVATSYLPFDTATSAQVILSVCNPVGGVCNTVNPGSTTAFTIGSVPSITTVNSASAFIQPTTVAPFDIISLFGFNFCPTCSSSQILTGTLDPKALVYPSTLSDGRNPSKSLVVTFKKHAGTGTMVDVTAPLLFATNNQINLLVPSTVSALSGSASVDIMVTFGGVDSQVFNVAVATTNPGIFTIGSDGQGSGAILASDYSLVTQANPAAVRTGTSDTVQIYMSGLGMPWTGLLNSDAGTGQGAAGGHWSADCISTASYTDLLNSATGGTYTIDGAVIQYSLMNGKRLAPCLSNAAGFVTATVGGIDAPVGYAGWVSDSVAGLYQVNVTLPLAGTSMKVNPTDASAADVTQTVSLPVIVKIGTGGSAPTSQSGVTIAVVKRLTVAPPAPLSSTIGVSYTSSTPVVATGGTGSYTYKLTSGQLPLGLKFNTDGSITGTPAIYTSGAYILTVTATDTASVTGTVTFTLTVLGGLGMSSSTTNPITSTFNTANNSLATITASGGIGPYTYTIAAPLTSLFTVPSSDSGITGTLAIPATTPAGTYNVIVHAADSTVAGALLGDITLPVAVALNITPTTSSQPTGTSAGVLATMSTSNTGKTGNLSYTLDAASIAAGFGINAATGAISVGSALPQTRSGVVRATDSGTATGAVASSHAVADIPFTVTVTALGALTITNSAPIAASTGSATTVPRQLLLAARRNRFFGVVGNNQRLHYLDHRQSRRASDRILRSYGNRNRLGRLEVRSLP
jgi:uncharacterized protein (TIGR03437 family)